MSSLSSIVIAIRTASCGPRVVLPLPGRPDITMNVLSTRPSVPRTDPHGHWQTSGWRLTAHDRSLSMGGTAGATLPNDCVAGLPRNCVCRDSAGCLAAAHTPQGHA